MTKSKDELFGRMIVSITILVTVSAVAYFGYIGYLMRESLSSNRTSIKTLEKDPVPASVTSVLTPTDTPAPADTSFQKETLPLLVLNGGAPKGSAAVLVTLLTADGFAKATAGSSTANYSGLIVYRSDGNDVAAEAVRKTLETKYPSVSVQPADPKRPETSKTPVVVIFGK